MMLSLRNFVRRKSSSKHPRRLNIFEMWELHKMNLSATPDIVGTVKMVFGDLEIREPGDYIPYYTSSLYLSGYLEFGKVLEALANASKRR